MQKLNNQRTKTLTDESSDESTDHGTPEPSTFESKKTHNRSEYRWKKIMFESADSTFCGRKIEASEIKSPLSYFMEYFSDAIFQKLAFETNQYSMLSSGISIKTTEQEIKIFWGCLLLWLILNFQELGCIGQDLQKSYQYQLSCIYVG